MNFFKTVSSAVQKLFEGDGQGQSFASWWNSARGEKSREDLLGEYKNLTYSCISVIAEDVGQYQPKFHRSKKTKDVSIEHKFLTVLENPNPYTSKFAFYEAYQSYMELQGESFWYVSLGEQTRKPKALYTMRPDRVDVVVDNKTGDVVGYALRRSGDGIAVPLELDEVIHIKMFNPLNPYRGLGSVQAGILYIDTETNTSEFQNNFMKNQATPSGVMSLRGKIGVEAFKKIKKQWKETNSGVKNAGKTLFIRNADAAFTKVGLAISDIDMGSLKGLTDERVRGIFRVPKPLLGDTDSSGLGRSNVEAIEYVFSKRTINPKLIRLDDAIRLAVKRYYKEDLYIDHVSQIPADNEAQLKEDTSLVDSVKTRNEIRKERGLNPVKGGDELYVGFNMVSVEDDPIESGSEGSKSHKHSLDCGCGVKKKGSKLLVKSAEGRYIEVLERLEQVTLGRYHKDYKKYLKGQEARVIQRLREELGETKKIAFEVLSEEAERGFVQSTTDSLLKILLGSYEKSGVLGLDFLGLPDETFITEQAARDAIFDSTTRLLDSFNDETAQLIQKQVAGGLADGETVDQITKRIESVYSDAEGYRARRIAQTESHKAINQGSAESYRQAGITTMEWRVLPGACEFCQAMNGSQVPIGTPFLVNGQSVEGANGGEYNINYTDVNYADLHPNCNCKLIPVIE